MQNISKLKQFYSIINKNFGYELKKYDPNSYKDFQLASNLIIENIEYSALQKYLPLNEIDITNQVQVKDFFKNPDNLSKLREAFAYIAQNNNKVEGLGYHKVYNEDGEFIGNAGFIIRNVNKDGKADIVERGIHLDSKTRDSNTGSKKQGCKVMRLVLDNLEDNLDKVDMNGKVLSSILKTNTRSQNFMLKHKLNIGEPTGEDDLTYKWEQPTKSFVARISEIKNSLGRDINR